MAKLKNLKSKSKSKSNYSIKIIETDVDKKAKKVLKLLDESEYDPENVRKKTLATKEVDKILYEIESKIEKMNNIKKIIKERQLDVKKIIKKFEKEGILGR